LKAKSSLYFSLNLKDTAVNSSRAKLILFTSASLTMLQFYSLAFNSCILFICSSISSNSSFLTLLAVLAMLENAVQIATFVNHNLVSGFQLLEI
jgi:hypothetical protein